jgi:hypothetical protein
MSEAFSGIWAYHRKQLWFCTKIMMPVQQLVMHKIPTPRTQHMDIKYFLICDWVERDLMHLECIDTKLNMADIFTKKLQRLTFHWHADFLLGHVSPKYSPSHLYLVGMYNDSEMDIDQYVPTTFTMPMLWLLYRFVPQSVKIKWEIRGCLSYGMVSTIHNGLLWIVGGCYCRYVDKILDTILLLSSIPCYWDDGTMSDWKTSLLCFVSKIQDAHFVASCVLFCSMARLMFNFSAQSILAPCRWLMFLIGKMILSLVFVLALKSSRIPSSCMVSVPRMRSYCSLLPFSY